MLNRLKKTFKQLFSKEEESTHFFECAPPVPKNPAYKIILVGLANSVIKKQFKTIFPERFSVEDLKKDEVIVGVEFFKHANNGAYFQFWMPSNDPRYHSVASAYYRGCNAQLICIDKIEDFEGLRDLVRIGLQNLPDKAKSYVLYDPTQSNSEQIHIKATELELIPMPCPDTVVRRDLFLNALTSPASLTKESFEGYNKLNKAVNDALPMPIMLTTINDITCSYLATPVSVRFFPLSKDFFPNDSKEDFKWVIADESKMLKP